MSAGWARRAPAIGTIMGQSLKPRLPLASDCVTPVVMLLLTAASIAALAPSAPSRPAPAAVVQARATVRIVNGVRLRFDGERNDDVPPLKTARIITAEGPRPAQLIEFE